MGFVIVQIVANTVFGLIIRHARTDPGTYFRAGAVNYFAGMSLALAAALLAGGLHFEWPVSLFAVYQGIQYQLAYIVLFALIAVGGLAVTYTFLRMSVVVPILGSIFIWGESPDVFRVAGILLMLGALPLLGADARRSAGPLGIRLPALLMLLAMAMTGTGSLAAKSFAELKVDSTAVDYSAFTFIGAAASSVVTWPLVSRLVRRHRLRSTAPAYPDTRSLIVWLAIGVALGTANFLQNSALVQALSELPGTLVFPVAASGYLLLISVADYTIWKRRFGKLTVAGALLGISGIVLANL